MELTEAGTSGTSAVDRETTVKESLVKNGRFQVGLLKQRLKQVAQGLQPAIYRRRTREAELLQELGIRVLDWSELRRSRDLPQKSLGVGNFIQAQRRARPSDHLGNYSGNTSTRSGPPKVAKAVKSKANASGRTYTSKFRGVHQTFPTRRWEAQFRRNGKPTSLGCFDQEEEAAKAYDKMMLWCEMHNASGVKGGITNFDSTEYEKELQWLQQCTQDELIESLRSEGRRQAAHRMLKQKRDTHHTTDEEGPSGPSERDKIASKGPCSCSVQAPIKQQNLKQVVFPVGNFKW